MSSSQKSSFGFETVFDNGEFARQGRKITGKLSVVDMPRVADSVEKVEPFEFSLSGAMDRLQRPVLDLSLSGKVWLQCQRCLEPVDWPIKVETRFTLFSDESKLDEAEQEDEELDGLLFDREFTVLALIEDEILLSLPYSPSHAACRSDADVKLKADKPNPFAVLAQLKLKSSGE
ncbi:YceD family protein [Chitinimonas sp. DQS-5]|uniref:Large ribosomal RNA subunit accumulation protein YceD n=2 Tax=Parachitinimonas caeni TaxID=3031301 RepID=A0ABT7DUT1_9NEIS|nr:YceD family protein [Parachitinimonas caeni]